jgi:poly(3-hydroxybutyrate) depolymerase
MTAAGGSGGGGGGGDMNGRSAGCSKPWTHATGQWVEVAGPAAHKNPAPLEGLVSIKGMSDTEDRGFWVYIPKNYDPNKAYKVIFSGAGCDDPDLYNAGKDGFPYQTIPDFDAIMVGLDYDTHSQVALCYDNRNPQSNDFTFMPWLQNRIENDFCVDTKHEFFSGYSSGGWVAQQFNCAFPTKFRGMVSVTGSEPMMQPTCVTPPAPTALFHIHDIGDPSNTYASFIPGCTRVLKQNGCTVTDCSNPESTTMTTEYTLPATVKVPQGTSCRQFNGCPADYPVVFCTTHLPTTANRHGDQREWSIPAFWNFMSTLK